MKNMTSSPASQTHIEASPVSKSGSLFGSLRRSVLAISLGLGIAAGTQSAVAQVNGGFEDTTGTGLNGWSTYSTSPNIVKWYNYTGTVKTPPVPNIPNNAVNSIIAPAGGSRAAISAASQPGFAGASFLYRDFTLPMVGTHTLTFKVGYKNWLGFQGFENPNIWLRRGGNTYDDNFNPIDGPNLVPLTYFGAPGIPEFNQQFRVDLVDPALVDSGTIGSVTTGVLKSIYRTQKSTDLEPADGAVIRSAASQDWETVTVDLTPYAGTTVRLRFAVAESEFYLDAFVDDVVLTSSGLPANMPPVANAGPNQRIQPGVLVRLDGSLSNDDNTLPVNLAYSWSFVSYPGATAPTLNLSDPVRPTFTPTVNGTYVVQLIVTDGAGLPSAPATVTLSSTLNQAPVAKPQATPTCPVVGQPVTLKSNLNLPGGSYDPENDPITAYQWKLTGKPSGSALVLNSIIATTATATITPDAQGTYVVSLTLSDNLGPGAPKTVSFTASLPIGYVEQLLRDVTQYVDDRPSSDFSSKGNEKDFLKILKEVLKDIQRGKYCKAVSDLDDAIVRVDGNNNPRDWIVNSSVRQYVFPKLVTARAALAGLNCCDDDRDRDDDDDGDDDRYKGHGYDHNGNCHRRR